jgi:hypothetical protein
MARAKPPVTASLLSTNDVAAGDAEQPQPEVLPAPRVGRGTRVKGGSTAALEWAHQRASEALARRQNAQEAIVLQQVLPLWTEDHRGVPNPMIRSGLFGTKASGNRQFLKGEAIASLSNFNIIYKGEELLQDDLSVWLALMNMAARQRIGDAIFFSGYQLVKDLGWRMHSDSYNRCKESISRLKANELKIQVKTGDSGYAGSLIREYAWAALTPDGEEKWMVRFEPMIAELFREDSVTFLAWEQRRQIGPRATLALWLHSYFTSHREPFPVTIAKIHELCKSDEKELRFFKRRVKAALERLVEIGFLTTFQIVGDTVSVKKAPVRLPNLKAAVTTRLS